MKVEYIIGVNSLKEPKMVEIRVDNNDFDDNALVLMGTFIVVE